MERFELRGGKGDALHPRQFQSMFPRGTHTHRGGPMPLDPGAIGLVSLPAGRGRVQNEIPCRRLCRFRVTRPHLLSASFFSLAPGPCCRAVLLSAPPRVKLTLAASAWVQGAGWSVRIQANEHMCTCVYSDLFVA